MSSDIVTRPTTDLDLVPDQAPTEIPDTLAKLQEWGRTFQAIATASEALAQSPFVPDTFKGKPASVTAAIMAGMELGFSPMASLQAFDVIQGKAAPRAITIAAILQSAGHEMRIIEWDDTHCILEGLRKGTGAWQRVEWTLARADQLGLLTKDQWKKQPKTMLRWRCTAELGRIIAPDALLGIPYSAEEVRDMPVVEATIVQSTTAVSPHGRSLQELSEERQAPPECTVEVQKAVDAALVGWGITSKEEKLRFVEDVIGRPVGSAADLSAEEATAVLTAATQ